MHHPTNRIAYTTTFITPVVEQWLELEIAQWIHHEGSIWQPITCRMLYHGTEIDIHQRAIVFPPDKHTVDPEIEGEEGGEGGAQGTIYITAIITSSVKLLVSASQIKLCFLDAVDHVA